MDRDRCRNELRSSFQKCKDEENSIVNLLNQFKEKQNQLLDKVEAFDAQECIDNRSKIMEETHMNYMLFNTLLSINVELDLCWRKYSARTSSFKCLDNEHEEIEVAGYKVAAIQAPPEDDNVFKLSPHLLDNDKSDVVELPVVRNVEVKSVSPHISPRISLSITTESETLSMSKEQIPETPNIPYQSPPTLKSSDSSIEWDKSSNSEPVFNPVFKETTSGIVLSISSGSTSNSNNKFNAPPETRPEIKPKVAVPETQSATNGGVGSVEKFFTNYQQKTRFDRAYENIKSPIPDLSFACEDSSSEYYSLPDNKSEKADVGKKPETDKNAKKKDPKENTPVIKEHELPNINDHCFITYMNDPSDFYITMTGEDIILSMGEQLMEYAKAKLKKKQFKTKLDAKLAIGEYCIAYSAEFKSWNRGHVLDWHMTEAHHVLVQYVDFGECNKVPFTHLAPIHEQFCFYPRQAIHCQLLNAVPANGVQEWPTKAIKEFEHGCYGETHEESFAEFRITKVVKEENRLAVDLLKIKGEGITLRELMIISGNAEAHDCQEEILEQRQFIQDQIREAQGLSGIAADGTLASGLDAFCQNVPETHDTIADAVMGYNAQDDRRICKFTRPDGTCYKGPSCRLEHKQRRPDGVTTDTENLHCFPESTYFPQIDEKLNVLVTHWKTPSVLYGQIKNEENVNGKIMKDIFKGMNSKTSISSYETFTVDPSVGENVIAKNFDNRWYRARVLEINASQWSRKPIVKVYFADFGDVADVCFDDLRKMTPAWAKYPHQVIKIVVCNVRDMPDYSMSRFRDFIQPHLNTKFSVTVKKFSRYVGCDLIDGLLVDADGNNFGQKLIDQGFAVANNEDIYPLRKNNIFVD